jgi:thioredoxin-like negative regulator of GroEL
VSTVLSIVLQASIAATGANTYPQAYQRTTETGRPLVVLVGADWCPACVQMKNNVIPQLEKQGSLEKVNFCCINTDQQNDLAKKLMRGGSIPQLIMFRRTRNGGWLRKQLNGAQSVTETQTFVSAPTEAAPQSTDNKLTHRPTGTAGG